MLIPLYGLLQGDSMSLLVLVHASDPVSVIGTKIQRAATVRVRPRPAADVYFKGVRLDPRLTVGEAKLAPLDRVDVVGKEAPGA